MATVALYVVTIVSEERTASIFRVKYSLLVQVIKKMLVTPSSDFDGRVVYFKLFCFVSRPLGVETIFSSLLLHSNNVL
jgi:hypothetical protein